MWARLCVVVCLAACYSATAEVGAPCTPSIENCPRGQTCALVLGEYRCVEDAPAIDGGIDGSGGDGPTSGAWQLVRSRGSMGNDVNYPNTTVGNYVIVAIETGNEAVTAVTDTGMNTYVSANARAKNAVENVGIEIWYARVTAPSTRVMATAMTTYAVVMWEVANLDAVDPLGTVARLDDQPTSSQPFGAPITTMTQGELVISVVILANTQLGLTAGSAFRNDQSTFGNGWAHLDDDDAPPGTYQAQWNQPNAGTSCATSVTFRR